MQTVVITGSSGFIGSYLTMRFCEIGWNVIALQRQKVIHSKKITFVPFEIGKPISSKLPSKIDLFIHSAWQPFNKRNKHSDKQNLQTLKELQQFAHKSGAKFIFLSTLSANDTSISHYGKTKLLAESALDYSKDLTLKLGLVIGSTGGFIQRIGKVIQRSKIIPLVDGGKQAIQILDIDDLFKVILLSYEMKLVGNFPVANVKPLLAKDIYRKMAMDLKCNPIFLYVPYNLMLFVLSIVEKFAPLPVDTENLKGLKQLRVFDTTEIQNLLNFQFLDAYDALNKALK